MTSNKYFNLNRFANLFKYDALLNYKTYLFSLIGVGVGGYVFCYLYFSMTKAQTYYNEYYIPMFLIYMMGTGIVIGTSFPALRNQIKRAASLMVPGSILEKFLVQFLIRIVIFIPIALFLFWCGINLARLSLVPNPSINYDPARIPYFGYGVILEDVSNWRNILASILGVLSIASILFAGSTFFNRYALAKTLVTIALSVLGMIIVFVIFSHIFFPEVVSGFDIHVADYKIGVDLHLAELYAFILTGIPSFFFLPLAYFKLKEKEV